MKKSTIIIFLLLQLHSHAQTNLKAVLDSVLLRSKEISMYSDSVNWDSLQAQVYKKAENAKAIQELKPAFETLLNGLRDHHGKIINAKDYSYIAWFTDHKNKRYKDTRTFDNETWKLVNDTSLKFEYKLLKGKVGYLKIVGIGPQADVEKEAKRIRESVMALYKQKVENWIIDLRYNTGGNMNPMMAGIAPLAGEGMVGSTVNRKQVKMFDWEIKNGNFIYFGYQVVTLPALPKFKKEPKIAVLTSRWTVSSGEIVATAFKGRPNTRFFGETTGGYTTNDGWDVISNEVILTISTGMFCDRKGNVYETNIPVDTEIPFEVIKDTEKDPCIVAAKKWLAGK